MIGWFYLGELYLLGLEVVYETAEIFLIIRDTVNTSKSHKNSYADDRTTNLHFIVGDLVYLKISPMKGVMIVKKWKF